MNIHIDMHDFIGATANVYKGTFGDKPLWFTIIKFDERTELFTGNFATKVEALMGAFDLVDTLKAAVQKLADAEGMKDFQDSVDAVDARSSVARMAIELLRDASDGPVADNDEAV